jgi:hypothetical protein
MLTIETDALADDGLDAHGNYSSDGDLYRPGERLDDLVPRMLAHLRAAFPQYDFAPARSAHAHGRSITMNVIDGPPGLDSRDAEEAFKASVLKEMHRFDRSRGNVMSDYGISSFSAFAYVDARYHARHAEVATGTEVASRMSLAAFKRTIKAGDRIVLESTDSPYAKTQAAIGMEREVIQVRSSDFIVMQDGQKIFFDFPKAAAFSCDGERFRISDAYAGEAARYRLYRWIRT